MHLACSLSEVGRAHRTRDCELPREGWPGRDGLSGCAKGLLLRGDRWGGLVASGSSYWLNTLRLNIILAILRIGPSCIRARWISWGSPELLRYIITLFIFTLSTASCPSFLTLCIFRSSLLSSCPSMSSLFVDLGVVGEGLVVQPKFVTLPAEEPFCLRALFLVKMAPVPFGIGADPT